MNFVSPPLNVESTEMKRFLILAFLVAFGSTAQASEPIDWADLLDQSAQEFDDPYRDLSYDDIESLRAVVRTREALVQGGQTATQQTELEQQAHDAERKLLERGLEADWLIEQRWVVAERREKAATAGNPAIDGQRIVLSGYAIPAPPDADGTPIAYLVPERGMCSHMPPPNANQMIRVRLNDAWQPRLVHEPVRLTGKISISPSEEVFRIIDGPVRMNATFTMDVEHAEMSLAKRSQTVGHGTNRLEVIE